MTPATKNIIIKGMLMVMLSFVFLATVNPAFAASTPPPQVSFSASDPNQPTLVPGTGGATTDPQASSLGTAGNSSGGTGSSTQGVTADLLGCSAGALLAQAISMGLSSLLGKGSSAVSSATTVLKVPVSIAGTQADSNLSAQTSAHSVQQFMGVPFGASLDAMGWCIVNSIISYVANATIQWANTGFQGNPAFVQNPGRFFQAIADQEAGSFIQQLAYNTTGLNLCQPFRVAISIGLAQSYQPRNMTCSLQQISQNVNNFAKSGISVNTVGGQIAGMWTNYNQTRQSNNNIWGVYQIANDQLYARTSVAGNTAQIQLGMNKGWLSFQKCSDPNNKDTCNTYTPGTLVESQLESTLNIPKGRLAAVSKFDQVITAVVNSLIKVALQKALSNDNNQPGNAASYQTSYYTVPVTKSK